jgi:CRISPR-associated protein Cas2
MKVLLIYDIPNDRVRGKVADLCLDYGLERIQYSSFQGDLRRTHQEELLLRVKKRLGKQAGDVRLIPICEKDWSARLEILNQSTNQQNGESANQQNGKSANQQTGKSLGQKTD